MSKDIQIFSNGVFELKVKENGTAIEFDASNVAAGLGWVREVNGKSYTRWDRVNKHLSSYSYPAVGKGDFIPESYVYLLAMKGESDSAVEFQKFIAFEVLPSIRRDSVYVHESATEEQKAYNYNMLDVTFKKIGAEFFMDEYKQCIKFHEENKTRLNYERSSKNRRADKKRSVAESKIKIMEKVLKIAADREQEYRKEFKWELKSLLSEVVKNIQLDIKTIKHNRTRGKLASVNKLG